MVRIVSGTQKDPNIALLQGMQLGQSFRNAQRQREADQQEQMGQMIQMRKLQMALDEQKLKRETLLNQQAQQGNAQAIQKLMLQQKMSPGESRMQDAMALLEGITDPKAYASAAKSVGQLLTVEEGQRKVQAAQTEIERAAKDGILDPNTEPADPAKPKKPGALPSINDYQSRLQAGEDPDAVVKDLSKARMQRATAAAHAEENMQAFEQAKLRLQSAPPGRERTLAQIGLKEFEMSPSRMEEEGSGAKLLAYVNETLVGPLSRQDAIAESTKAWGDKQPAPGLKGMTVGQRSAEMEKEPGFFGGGGPKVPPFTGGTHETVRSGVGPGTRKAPKRLPSNKIKNAKTSAEITQILQAAGIPLTPEVATEVQNLRSGRGR